MRRLGGRSCRWRMVYVGRIEVVYRKSYARVLMSRDAFIRSFLAGDWAYETKANGVLKLTLYKVEYSIEMQDRCR